MSLNKLLLITSFMLTFAIPAMANELPTASPSGHTVIKASIVDANPAHFVINVKQLANMFADQDAPTFAVYTSNSVPKICGNFEHTKITYEKPSQYVRVFNLTKQPGILQAIEQYKCVIIPNIPPTH